MGITTASARAWDEGMNHPKTEEVVLLAKCLGFSLGSIPNSFKRISGLIAANGSKLHSKSKFEESVPCVTPTCKSRPYEALFPLNDSANYKLDAAFHPTISP